MFVINTSESSGFQNASVSGKMDVDLYGGNYVMFPSTTPTYCLSQNCCLITNNDGKTWEGTQYLIGWNGKCPGACSYFKCFKANDIDHDVLFPYNYICSGGNRRQFTAGWCSTCCSFIRYNLGVAPTVNTVHCGCETDIFSGWLLRRTASRKVFEGGEMVGKKIEGYLRMFQDVGLTYYCGYYDGSSLWCIAANSCPFCVYTDIGLIHEDGTKSSLVYCANSFPYGHIDTRSSSINVNWNSERVPTSCSECCITNVLPGILETDGLIAEAGDRLYIEFGTTEDSRLKYEYKTNCNCCYKFTIYSRNGPYMYSLLSGSTMYNPIVGFKCNCCLRQMCLYDCNGDSNDRYPGISFSIE